MITDNDSLSIPCLLVAFRKEYKLSQAQLGQMLDCDYQTISNWENGKGCKERLRYTLKGLEGELCKKS